jgi:cytoskeletal protein CcmA (bactofilin family)
MPEKIFGKNKLVLAAALVFLVSCLMASECYFDFEEVRGSGNVIREERDVSGFTGVKVSNQGDLKIELGDREKLVIEAEDNLMEYIETYVEDGVLRIGTETNINIRNKKPIRYYLTAKKLDYLATSSSGDIEAPALKADDFTVKISSSGDIDIQRLDAEDISVGISSSGNVVIDSLNADDLSVKISSSGDLKIREGEVKTQVIHISSSGNYEGSSVESQKTEARISSSGNAKVWVTEYLDVHLSSSGDLYYKGDPDKFYHKETSSGDVIKIR